MGDSLVRAVVAGGSIRAFVCVTTRLTREICGLQGASVPVSIALGRALAGASLMAATLKGGDRIALKFEGNGPMGSMVVEGEPEGTVRGSVSRPDAVLDPSGIPSISNLLGKAGLLTVTKDLGLREPYRGVVPLHTSEIGEDLAWYLADSEQIPSAVGLSANVDASGSVSASGGFLIQSLPPADQDAVDTIMNRISLLPPLSQMLANDTHPSSLLAFILEGTDCRILDEYPLRFRCTCSRKRVENALATIGISGLQEMSSSGQHTDVTCEFCKKAYSFSTGEIEAICRRLHA